MKKKTPGEQQRTPDAQPSGVMTHLAHVGHAFLWSLAGLRSALRHETAFRLEVALFVFLAPLGIWLGHNGVERAMLVGSLMLVLMVELVNSAIEAAVDRISEKRHPLSKRAKDLGSAAVFLCLVNVPVVWGLIVADRFLG